jgi:hypothetical protein
MCAKRRPVAGRHADLGARSFIVHDERFARQTREWVDAGLVAPWAPALVAIDEPGRTRTLRTGPTRYVGTPAMHAPVRHIAENLGPGADLRQDQRITSIRRAGGAWELRGAHPGAEQFDAVALAIPAPQAAELLIEIQHLHTVASAVPMSPCWGVMATFDRRLPVDFDAANIMVGGRHDHAGVLAWADRESSKPGRGEDECWVLHATEEWSRDHLGADPDEVTRAMLAAFFDAVGVGRTKPEATQTQCWRYAFPIAPLCDGCLYDEQLQIGACGDWCMGARVEGAFLSGLAMAARLLGETSDFLEPCLINHSG